MGEFINEIQIVWPIVRGLNKPVSHWVILHIKPFAPEILVGTQQPIETSALPFPWLWTKLLSQYAFEPVREISDRQLLILDGRNNPVDVIGYNHTRQYVPSLQLWNRSFDGFKHFRCCRYLASIFHADGQKTYDFCQDRRIAGNRGRLAIRTGSCQLPLQSGITVSTCIRSPTLCARGHPTLA